MAMVSGHKFRSDGHARAAANASSNAARSLSPPMYMLHDELVYVALQLTEPDSLLALRATSKVLRERLNARVRLDEHVCTTSPTDSFVYDLTLNHFTKSHTRVPADVGERLVTARWSVGDRAFVGFSKALLTRRVPSGDFSDITPAECKLGGILFAAGYGRDVWVGTASVVVHVRLTPNLSAIERTISSCEMSSACRSACANHYGLFGCCFVPASPGDPDMCRWTGSSWAPVLAEHDANGIARSTPLAVSPSGAICYAAMSGHSGTSINTLMPEGLEFAFAPRVYWHEDQDMCAMARGHILIGGGINELDGAFWETRWLVPSGTTTAPKYVPKAAFERHGTRHSFLEADISITYHWRISPVRTTVLAAPMWEPSNFDAVYQTMYQHAAPTAPLSS